MKYKLSEMTEEGWSLAHLELWHLTFPCAELSKHVLFPNLFKAVQV